MAIVSCKECNKEISNRAGACPNCGAKPARSVGPVGIIFALLIGFAVYSCNKPREDTARGVASSITAAPDAAQSPAAGTAEGSSAQAAAPTKPANWNYRSTPDAMKDSTTRFASTTSLTTLSFDFPYNGPNFATITLRKTGKELDILVSIAKGQILCRSYSSPCSVKVKFDGAKAETYGGNGPADHSTTTLFLSPEKRFIERLKKSKRLLVELNIYQQGTQVLEFDTEGLDW